MFQFTDDCLLGVEELDGEHRHLFDLLSRGMYMLNNEYSADQYSGIKSLLEELEEYADMHFAHEEAYMEKLLDPELLLQRSQHMFFREKVLEFLVQNIDEEHQQREVLENLMNFLARWLYHHIIGSDMLIGKLPPLEEWMIRENPCEFTDEYMTGIDMIDREHKILFDIIDRANKMVRAWSEGDSYEGILKIIRELQQYTENHFADEEEYMLAVGYEGYQGQKRAHEAFISRLEGVDEKELQKEPKAYLASLIEFLLGWLINHILNADKKIPLS